MKIKISPYVPALLAVIILVAPHVAQAQLVPCTGINCEFCSVGQMIQKIITFLIGVSIPIATALFAYAGFLYSTAGGNPGKIGKAHTIFINVGIGFILALTGWLVINTILTTLLANGVYAGGKWFSIPCASGRKTTGSTFATLLQGLVMAPATNSGIISIDNLAVTTTVDSKGNTTTTYADGSTITKDSNGNTTGTTAGGPLTNTGGTNVSNQTGDQPGLANINGVTAYFPGYSSSGNKIEGPDVDAHDKQTYTIQDCIDNNNVCAQPVTVATSQTSGIAQGTIVTWPALIQQYNSTYGTSLPLDTPFAVNDKYAPGYGNGTFDIAQCAAHNTNGCFTKVLGNGGSFSNLGSPTVR